jgi:hypothetical protein
VAALTGRLKIATWALLVAMFFAVRCSRLSKHQLRRYREVSR